MWYLAQVPLADNTAQPQVGNLGRARAAEQNVWALQVLLWLSRCHQLQDATEVHHSYQVDHVVSVEVLQAPRDVERHMLTPVVNRGQTWSNVVNTTWSTQRGQQPLCACRQHT